MALPDTPKPKTKLNKWWLIGGGVGAVAIFLYYRKQQAANAAATTDPNIDPNTGLPYADTGTGTGGGTLSSYIDPLTGQTITPNTGSPPVGPPTNAAWVQQSEAYLIAQGYDPATTLAALGVFIAGGTLSAEQYAIVQSALAAEGNPPQYVPPPHMAPPTGQRPPDHHITIPPPHFLPHGLRQSSTGKFIVPGTFNQRITPRELIKLMFPHGSPNELEAMYRRFLKANPTIKGNTPLLGGHQINPF